MSSSSQSYANRLKKLTANTTRLSFSMLVSATYDGEKKAAVLKFYNPATQDIHLWFDGSGHKPYCYSKQPPEELAELGGRPDVVEIRKETKLDLLLDREVEVSKIVATDPLAIGGSPSEKSIRNVIDAWEADIKYYENYLYDKGLIVGAYYEIQDSQIIPVESEIPRAVEESLQRALSESTPDFRPKLLEWAKLLSQPLPELRRVAIDIEVFTPEANRVPDAMEAQHRIVAVSFVGSDGAQEVFLLKRSGVELGKRGLSEEVKITFFDEAREREMVEAVFERLLDYPFVITFNGDDFDLNYLYHRAQRLGLSRKDIPISMGNNVATVEHGVHIDLYKTFNNRSLQVYAFGNKYVEHTLNGVSEALINESKMEFEGALGDLPIYELANYCHRDALITFKLTGFNASLLMKLLLVVSRVARMPIDDVARLGVSNWIRSLLYFEHRRMNALIPRREELEVKGGAYSEPIIKGKKYKGALVVEPEAGVHFGVSVLDFASLYPSIIKVHNLSYETVKCSHPECSSHLIPGTQHWVCTRRRGLYSLVFGSLRDLRVDYYKPLAKTPFLTEEERNLYHVVAQALKVILNAAYGVMGAEIFPLYCLPVAEATAAVGRYAISKTIEQCRDLGIKVVYGDTDSLFLESPSKGQIEQISAWAETELGIELDVEKTYRYVAFSQRKKNYLGVLPDGNVDIKGLTGKKSHTPPFIRNVFYEAVNILSRVKSPDDFESAREAIKADIRAKYLALRSRQIPLQDLAFNVMIGKPPSRYTETTPQHIKAAQLLMKTGREIKAGDIIAYVKTSTPPGVRPLEMAKPEEVDNEKYLESLRSTFDQLLDALGYEFDEILGATKLEDFFWPA